jgi:hypothetical protein
MSVSMNTELTNDLLSSQELIDKLVHNMD